MTTALTLLPVPRRLQAQPGSYQPGAGSLILLDMDDKQAALFTARRLQDALRKRCSVSWDIVATSSGGHIGMTMRISRSAVRHDQGYRLVIAPTGLLLEAHDDAGLFYGVCTLAQIIEQCSPTLPCLEINDWPDFPQRGVMLDVSRDKIPTMATLLALIDKLAGWKINQLQLYTEHTFAYRDHAEVLAPYSPITGQDVLELDSYCRQRYVQLVPNQNSFGHVERWLIHPRYAALGEGGMPDNTLCPTDPASLDFLGGLFDELLPHFTSHMFNVGCDETEIGTGRSKDACRQRGEGRVYLDFLLGIYRLVEQRKHTMQFWGDIIMRHPELIPELPKDCIALEWGYEADHPFAAHGERFAASGIPFYVCPGTSSWNTIAGRTDNALGCLRSAAANGLANGAIGYLNTDWGDRGHWQALPVSYLGYAAGAAYSWAVAANKDLDVAAAISRHAFGDVSGAMGRVAYDLGNVYHATGVTLRNSNVLFRMLHMPLAQITTAYPALSAAKLRRTEEAIDQAMAPLAGAQMAGPEQDLVRDEYRFSAWLMKHACRRGLLALDAGAATADSLRELDMDMFGIIQEFSRLWLARNRPGGLGDSARRLEAARQDYASWPAGGKYPWW